MFTSQYIETLFILYFSNTGKVTFDKTNSFAKTHPVTCAKSH